MSSTGLLPGGTAAKSNMDVPDSKDQDPRTLCHRGFILTRRLTQTEQASDMPAESPPDYTEETFKILKAHIDAVEAMVAALDVDEIAQLAMSLSTDLDAALGLKGTKE
ncbi:hypothetical protein Sste5346_009681 [Sporothrix stenoceras]|uniref:Uncharacterized protein n=1 Tax=Sporothrix stenoceras TaxID=5173 RepID=A0ABR3YLM3_9PEZI